MSRIQRPVGLDHLEVGQPIVFGGDRVTHVGDELAANFRSGDHLVVVQETGDLLHVPAHEHDVVEQAVSDAVAGFAGLATCTDDQIGAFFGHFARLLADDVIFRAVAEANAIDVASARERGRSTTRLELTPSMRESMIAGLRGWQHAPGTRDEVVDTVIHDGWTLEARRAPLGVVAFVFEGRPNVFADACGVLRSGNSVVFRIGSDALSTARTIVEHALAPALHEAGLPSGAARLIDSPSRSAGHALFSDRRLALAVARGSGAAVAQLGAVASQAGVPVSLHGTGGAWIVVGDHADEAGVRTAVHHSLDRKVCNTVNCVAVVRSQSSTMMPAVLAGLHDAAVERHASERLHVVAGSDEHVPAELFDTKVEIERAGGVQTESLATTSVESDLAIEWEWETSPELTVVVVDSVEHAVELFDRYSPHFVASLISDDVDEQQRFYASVDAPFVGDGFTRWVDGQYALDKPELGLSNWQGGRMLGRGAILSGDSVHTVRYRASITDATTRR